MSSFFRKKIDGNGVYRLSYYSWNGPADGQRSAEAVVPIVASLTEIRSVVDVGCGTGAWLAAFRNQGAEHILGLDEDVDPARLRIPRECFRKMDLSKPFELAEQFDLALCLEVAEHLPKKCAGVFIRSLVRLAPVILFSAAVPFQGGTHHVNEQWPQYWQDLFAQHDYQMLDLIRKEIWKRPEVQHWYRQNIFLFVRADVVSGQSAFLEATKYADDLLLVHKDVLQGRIATRSLLEQLPGSLWRAGTRRLRRHFR
jgi:SAM-dependent methyltransferase